MDNNLAFSKDTLMGALGSWNRQEDQFRELFGEQALRGRDFQKMKLREYDRIFIRHQGKAVTTDDKALLVMLRYQRRRMERTLRLGLLRRFLRALGLSLSVLIERRQERSRSRLAAPFPYEQIPVPTQREQQGEGHTRQTDLEQRRRYGPDLGGRRKPDPGKRQGQSL